MRGAGCPGVVSVTSPAPRDAWAALLRDDPDALATQSPAWVDCLAATVGGEDASRLYELECGRGVLLPLVRRARLGGRAATLLSYGEGWGMGGLLAPGGPTAGDVAAVAASLAADPAVRTIVRPNPLHAEAWRAADTAGAIAVPRRAHVIDVAGGFDHVWQRRFSARARNTVRKAERAGLEVELDTDGRLVPAYYALYERSLGRWAARQHEPPWLARWRGHRRDPLAKMSRIARDLGPASQLWVARLGGRPVAALIVLRAARTAHATRAVMDAEAAGPTGAMSLLTRHAIEDACNAGCTHYHYGESGGSRSLSFFKEQFGAVAVPYAEYRFERLPVTRLDGLARTAVKRAIGFRDTGPE